MGALVRIVRIVRAHAEIEPSQRLRGYDPRTIANNADDSGREQVPTVRAKPLKFCVGTAADGEDANLPSQSVPGRRRQELCP